MRHLNDNAEKANWSRSSAENAFVQYPRDTLSEQANEFASKNKLTESEKDAIRNWIGGLPGRTT